MLTTKKVEPCPFLESNSLTDQELIKKLLANKHLLPWTVLFMVLAIVWCSHTLALGGGSGDMATVYQNCSSGMRAAPSGQCDILSPPACNR